MMEAGIFSIYNLLEFGRKFLTSTIVGMTYRWDWCKSREGLIKLIFGSIQCFMPSFHHLHRTLSFPH